MKSAVKSDQSSRIAETGLTAASADKYDLYAQAFQAPLVDVRFCQDVFRRRTGRSATCLREDFCGTAAVACEWVASVEDARALAVDIDDEPLDWCRIYRLPSIAAASRSRLVLVQGDVRAVDTPPAEVIAALNSSFFVFKNRSQLRRYFRRCHGALAHDGVLVLGCYAGPEAHMVGTDRIPCDGFTAIWEQAAFDAATSEAKNCIHFEFPDGSRISSAFEYDYRIWSPRELTDALTECGYRNASVYSRSSASGEGRGVAEAKNVRVDTYWDVFVVGCKSRQSHLISRRN